MLKRLSALMLLAALAAPGQFHTFPDKTYFREQWQRAPLGMEIETVANLEDFHHDEKLELSLRAFLELAMSNNPDINLQKLAILEQQNNIQRAYSPFDPNVAFNFSSNRSTTPSADQLEGAAVRTRLNQNGGFTYRQSLDTGTNYTIGYVGAKAGDNSQFANFNPTITQSLLFTVSQPLLRDRGRFVQRIPILIAESRLSQTEEQVREQVINLLFQATRSNSHRPRGQSKVCA